MKVDTKMSVRQPLTWSNVPRSEGGTVTGTPGTAIYSDPIRIDDSETQTLVIEVSNVSGSTHALVKYWESWDWDNYKRTGTWTEVGTVVADLTDDDTVSPYALGPILAPYIRFEFTGAASNGAYNRIRGLLHRQ